MRKFNYKLDAVQLGMTEEDINQKVTFERYLEKALVGLYPQGLDNKTRREYGRLLDKLDASTDNTLTLEESEFDLINDAFTSNKVKFEPNHTRLINMYVRAIEGAQKL